MAEINYVKLDTFEKMKAELQQMKGVDRPAASRAIAEAREKGDLKENAEYDAATNIVKLPTLMSWFRRDFGGKKKMIELLKQLSIIPVDKNPKVKFKSYDWTLYLENYKL